MARYTYFLELGIAKIGLNQDFMLIDKKKDAHRGSYRHFLRARQLIYTWVTLKLLYQEFFLKLGAR